jgi:hypothetical protein
MHRAVLLLLFFLTFSVGAAEVWPSVTFAEVRAYAWPGDDETTAVILPGMALKKGVLNKDGATLTAEQVGRLLSAVRGARPRRAVAMCHVPHNAFVFYDASHSPVAFIEICFLCLSDRVEPAEALQFPDLLTLAAIFSEHKLPMGEYPDFAAFKQHYDEMDKMFHTKAPASSGSTGS